MIGAAIAALNLIGSLTMGVWGVEHEGEPWAHFRWSGGGYAPTEANAASTRGTILSHPNIRISVPEAIDLAAGLRAWLAENHNQTIFRYPTTTPGSEMGISFTGNNGVTWGPQYEPVVIVRCQYWLSVQERGHLHGEMYVPLPVAEVEALATALETWTAKPHASPEALFAVSVQ